MLRLPKILRARGVWLWSKPLVAVMPETFGGIFQFASRPHSVTNPSDSVLQGLTSHWKSGVHADLICLSIGVHAYVAPARRGGMGGRFVFFAFLRLEDLGRSSEAG